MLDSRCSIVEYPAVGVQAKVEIRQSAERGLQLGRGARVRRLDQPAGRDCADDAEEDRVTIPQRIARADLGGEGAAVFAAMDRLKQDACGRSLGHLGGDVRFGLGARRSWMVSESISRRV